MKVRFYPKTKDIISLVSGRIDVATAGLSEAKASQKEIESRTLYTPDADKRKAAACVASWEEEVSELQSQLFLLVSHLPPEMMAEIDL